MRERKLGFQILVGLPRGNISAQKQLDQDLDIQFARTLKKELSPSTIDPILSPSLAVIPFAFPPNMLRTAAVRALRAAAAPRIIRQAAPARPHVFNTALRSSQATPSIVFPSIRCYSAPAGLSKDEVQGRILDLLKNFDKVRLDPPPTHLFSFHADIWPRSQMHQRYAYV